MEKKPEPHGGRRTVAEKTPTQPAPAVWGRAETGAQGRKRGRGPSFPRRTCKRRPSQPGILPSCSCRPCQPGQGRPVGAERARPPRVTPDSLSLGPAPPGPLRFSCRYWAMMAAFQPHMPYISRRSLLAQASASPCPPPLAHFEPEPLSPQPQPPHPPVPDALPRGGPTPSGRALPGLGTCSTSPPHPHSPPPRPSPLSPAEGGGDSPQSVHRILPTSFLRFLPLVSRGAKAVLKTKGCSVGSRKKM